MPKPDLSAILVLYQSQKYVGSCVNSLKKAAEIAELTLEFIFVFNDRNKKGYDSIRGAKIFHDSINHGYAEGINLGVKLARGKWLLIANPDTETDPAAFRRLKKKEELPKYISRFDIGMIPYQMNGYGQAAYPVKIMEYLSCGIPVVATDLPSLSGLKDKKVIYTAKTSQEFIKKCRMAIKENDRILRMKRIRIAKKYSWSKQILKYLKLIEI